MDRTQAVAWILLIRLDGEILMVPLWLARVCFVYA